MSGSVPHPPKIHPPTRTHMTGLQTNIGLISGINYVELVEQLIQIDSIPQQNLLARTERLAKEKQALSELMSRFLISSYMIRSLNSASPFKRTDVSSSNAALISVTKTGSPVVGSYTFTPLQMASTQQTVAKGVASDSDALGKTGTITLGKAWTVENDNSTKLSDLNGGQGFVKGSIRITDGNGVRTTIDLRKAMTIKDVLNAINENDNIDVLAELDNDRIILRDVSGGDLSKFAVQEVSGGGTAASLGLVGSGVTVDTVKGTITGSSIWRISEDMSLSLLNDGNGVVFENYMPDLSITCKDGSIVRVDFHKASTSDEIEAGAPAFRKELTVGDLLNTINNATTANGITGKVAARISDDGKGIVIEDKTTGNGVTSIMQTGNTNPILRTLGLTSDDRTITVNMFTNYKNGAEIYFEDKAGNNAVVKLSEAEIISLETIFAMSAAGQGASACFANLAGRLNTKLEEAGVGITVQMTNNATAFNLVDTSGGSGEMTVADHGSDFATKIGLTGNEPVDMIVALAAASPGTIQLTDQTGRSMNIAVTRQNLDSIQTAQDLADMFQERIDAYNANYLPEYQVGITVSVDGNKVIFSDTSGGTASSMMITDGDGGSLAAMLGLNATKSTDLLTNILDNLAPGEISVTDRNGNSAVIEITQNDLDDVTTLSGIVDLFNRRFTEEGIGVNIEAVTNSSGTGLVLRDITGGTANLLQISDVSGDLVDLLGLTSTQTDVQTFLAGVTPGEIRFRDQNGNTADIEFDQSEIDAVTSLAELATLFNDKLTGEGIGITVTVNGAGTGLIVADTSGGTMTSTQITDVSGDFSWKLGIQNLTQDNSTLRTLLDGVTPGEITFSDRDGNTTTIEFTQADLDSVTNVYDLSILFNNKLTAAGCARMQVLVDSQNSNTRLSVVDHLTPDDANSAISMQVVDEGSGNLASSLGFSAQTDVFTLFSTNNTINNGSEAATPGTLRFTDRYGTTADITISQAELDAITTFEDVKNLFNDKLSGTGVQMEAGLAFGTRFFFESTSVGGTTAMSITAVDDTNLADLLRLDQVFPSNQIGVVELGTFRMETPSLVHYAKESVALENHEYASDALVSHYAETSAIEMQTVLQGEAIKSGTFETRNLLGGLSTVLVSTLNGGYGLSTAKGGAVEVQDRAGNTAKLDITQADLKAMQTLSDAVKIYNQKLTDAGIGLTVRINDSKTGLQVVDTTGSTSHNLIFRDFVTETVVPGTPDTPATNAKSGSFGTAAVSGGGGRTGDVAVLKFNNTDLLNGFEFGFTEDPLEALIDVDAKKIIFHIDGDAIVSESNTTVRNQMVKAVVDAGIAAAWSVMHPPGTFVGDTFPPPELEIVAGLAMGAVADAATGSTTKISVEEGGTLGQRAGTAILEFEQTHMMNNFAFGFTTSSGAAGYDSDSQTFTFLLSQDILDLSQDIADLSQNILAETDPDVREQLEADLAQMEANRDQKVKNAIDTQVAALWTTAFPASLAAEYPPATVALTAGLGEKAVFDAKTGGQTAIKYSVPSSIMGEAAIPGTPDTTVKSDPKIASSFGLNVNAASSSVSGTSLHRQIISNLTLLTDLNGGAGVNVTAGRIIVIDSKGTAGQIDITPDKMKTVGDFINAINNLNNVMVNAKINATGDGILLEEFAQGTGSFSIYDADSSSKFASSMRIAGSVNQSQKDEDGRMRMNVSETHTIEVEEADSLDKIRQKINDLNAGYSATIIVDGSNTPYRLSVSGKATGAAGAFNLDLSAIGLTSERMTEAKDAMIAYGDAGQSTGLVLNSKTNTFKGLINGMDLTITGTSESPVTITSASSSLDVKVALESFVTNYNTFREFLNKQINYTVDSKGQVMVDSEGGNLWNSSVGRDFDRLLSDMILKRVDGIPGIYSLANLGITMRSNYGDYLEGEEIGANVHTNTLSFDADVFQAAWDADPEAVQKFFFDEREYKDSSGKVTKVNYGWAQKFADLTDQLVGSANQAGKVQSRIDVLTTTIDRNEERVAFMQERLDWKREYYLKQFYAMEQAMAKMTSDMSAVSNLASAWQQNYSTGA